MTTTAAELPVRFARLVKIEHTVFALPFAYVGALLAAGEVPSGHDLLWITIAMVGARSLAMGLNRLIATSEADWDTAEAAARLGLTERRTVEQILRETAALPPIR